jgi:hypothetical protein
VSERIPDLSFEFIEHEGTTVIRLEQSAGCGETVFIDMHSSQLRFIAERAGLLNSEEGKVKQQRDLLLAAAKGRLADLCAAIEEVERNL